MVNCTVFGCFASQEKYPNRSFHKFPKDVKLRKAWITRINRKDFTPSDSSTVCSYHFKESDYERKRKSDRPIQFQKRRLESNAVPNCNLQGEKEDTRMARVVLKNLNAVTAMPYASSEQLDVLKNQNAITAVPYTSTEQLDVIQSPEIEPRNTHRTDSTRASPYIDLKLGRELKVLIKKYEATKEALYSMESRVPVLSNVHFKSEQSRDISDEFQAQKFPLAKQCCVHNCKKMLVKLYKSHKRSDSEGSDDEESTEKRKHLRSFHRFPTHQPLRKNWIKKLRLNGLEMNWSPPANSVVCSDHFSEKDMHRTDQLTCLQWNVVPTRFKRLSKHSIMKKPKSCKNTSPSSISLPQYMRKKNLRSFGVGTSEHVISQDFSCQFGTSYLGGADVEMEIVHLED